MRSPASADLTARARIRDAAVRLFGAHGFGLGLRAVAEGAGVSAALIVRHYGSKDRLRETCDEHVLEIIRAAKARSLGTGDATAILRELAISEEYEDAARYTLRSLNDGGPLARALFEHMVDDAVEYLDAGVRAGVIRPTADPRARARFLTQAGLGALMVQISLEEKGLEDMPDLMQRLEDTVMLPALELYTHGIFTDDRILQALRAGQGAGPGAAPHDVAPDPPPSDGTDD